MSLDTAPARDRRGDSRRRCLEAVDGADAAVCRIGLPADQLLPDRQPAYMASWIYVFGVLT